MYRLVSRGAWANLQGCHVGEHLGSSKEDLIGDGGSSSEHSSKADGGKDIRIVGLSTTRTFSCLRVRANMTTSPGNLL